MGQDLAGHALAAFGTMKTRSDPGIFSQDGFESPLVAAVEAGAPMLVKEFAGVPAIGGTQSLWLAPGDAVTFHLRRAAAEKTLHFSARAFGQFGSPSFYPTCFAGVVGGQAGIPSNPTITMSSDTTDSTWTTVSEVLSVSVPLTGTGADVIMHLAAGLPCFGFCAPPTALMIDDLTLE